MIGISNGFANVLGSSTWAEIYGVKHIGSIKALTTALMVFSTAFGTALFGLLIDSGFSIEQRKNFYASPDDIIGKEITVQYFEESQNQNGEYSLRFPVIKAIYENKRSFRNKKFSRETL